MHIRVIEDESFESFSGDIENIKRTFDISLSDTKEQMLISRTFVGRRWLSEMLEDWRLNDSSSRVFILYGGPGIGKSTFAAHQIHYNPHVMCGFFCEWDKAGQKITRNVIKNISFKLAKVRNLYIKLYDPDSKKTLIQYRVNGNMGRDTAIVIGMAYKKNGSWNFKAIGRSLRVPDVRTLASRCSDYI